MYKWLVLLAGMAMVGCDDDFDDDDIIGGPGSDLCDDDLCDDDLDDDDFDDDDIFNDDDFDDDDFDNDDDGLFRSE